MTTAEMNARTDESLVYECFKELHDELKKRIKKHTKLKTLYRSRKRDGNVGRAYLASCRRMRGVHWSCEQCNKLRQKGILYLSNPEFSPMYMIKIVLGSNLSDDMKNFLVTSLKED